MAEFQYLDEGSTEAQDRLATAFLLAQDQPGLATDGVLNGLAVTQTGTASGSVQIAPGACVAQDTVANGPAVLVNSSTKTLDILGSNPLGALKRNDLVVFDAATKTIRQVVGTPNAAPSDPAMPANAVLLARLLLDPATSATTVVTAEIMDGRTFTSLFGVDNSDTGWTTSGLTLSTGWTNAAGYTVQMRKKGNRVQVRGAVVRGGGATDALFTVPAGWRPTTSTFLGAHVDSGGTVHELHVNTSGAVANTYQTTGIPVGATLPVTASWLVD